MTAILRKAHAEPDYLAAQVAALAHRARIGEVSPERLVMAARLGHEVARAYAGDRGSATVEAGLALLDDADRRLWVCDCAERVLFIYESEYPSDARPRNAIEVARRYARGQATQEELLAARNAARNAARAARAARADEARADDARADAAWAAAWAADDAVDAASWAAVDAAWAAAKVANHALGAWYARHLERDWQRQRLCDYLLGEVGGCSSKADEEWDS